jgi:xyloglucan-specific exo-beta-1,4-glucanase
MMNFMNLLSRLENRKHRKTFWKAPYNKQPLSLLLLMMGLASLLLPCKIKAQTTVQYRWKNVTIGGTGFVTGIITCPTRKDLIFARTDVGGAYRWNPTDSSWIPITDWVSQADWLKQGIESIAIDPSEPNRVYMAAGMYANNSFGCILRSTDYGTTFKSTGNITPMGGNDLGRSNGERLAVDPNKDSIIYFASRQNGLMKSTDYGVSWNKISSFPVSTTSNGNGSIFVKFIRSTGTTGHATPTLFVGVSQTGSSNFYYSKDSGTTWQAVYGQITTLMPQHAAVESDSIIYLTYCDSDGPYGISSGKVKRFNIRDSTWTDITPSTNQGGFGGVTVDPLNPGTIMVTTMNDYNPGDLVFRSTNRGKTWNNLRTHAVLSANGFPWSSSVSPHWTGDIQLDPFNSNKAMLTTGYGIWTIYDAAADSGVATHWYFTNKGLEESVPNCITSPPSGAQLLSVIADYDGFKSDDVDVSPTGGRFSPNMGSSTGIDFAQNNANFVVRVGNSSPYGYYSINGGTSWTAFAAHPTIKSTGGSVAVSADSTTLIWSPTSGSVSYSTDNGGSWKSSSVAPSGSTPFSDRVNSKKFYIYQNTSGNVYVSTNGGASFSNTTTITSWGGTARAVPGIEGDIWIPVYDGLWHSTNSGTSFKKLSTVGAASQIGFGKHAPGKTYPSIFLLGTINSVIGVFRSDDMGATWIRVNDASHQFGQINMVAGDPRIYGRVYIGTGGRGIVYGEPLYDCHGDSLGTAFYDNCDSCVSGNTGKVACLDCNGTSNGTAYTDSCGNCVGGITGKTACSKDCNGDWGGTAYTDNCDSCVSGNTGKVACIDCNGVSNGTAYTDSCGKCVSGNTGDTACTKDCNGDWGGTAYTDSCQICVGGNTGEAACTPSSVDLNTAKSFSYSPNPFTDKLHLQTNIPSVFKIVNTSGMTIESVNCTGDCYIGSNLQPGIYILYIRNQTEFKIIKIIKL